MSKKANVKLGNDIIQNIDNVQLEDADNQGEYVEFNLLNNQEKTVELSLAEGNQEVIKDEDYTGINKVTIKKPATLESQNIRKGINIAGVKGIFEGGSKVQANVTTTDTDPYLTSLQIDENKYRVKSYDNDITQINETIEAMYHEINNNADSIRQVGSETSDNTSSIQTINTNISTLNTNVDKNTQDIESINTNISTLNTNVNKNTQDIESINTNISTLNTNVDKNTQDIESINTNVNKNTQDIENINTNISTLNTNVNKNTQDIESINTNGTIRRVEELPVNATCFFIIVDKYGVTQPTNYFDNKYWYVNPEPVATLNDLPTANADNKNKIYYVTAQSKAYCCYTADNTTYNWVVLDTILTNLGQTITYVAERPLIKNRVASQGYFVYNNTDLPNVNDFYEVEVVTDSGTIENFSKTNDITILSSDEISYVNPTTFPFHIIGVKSLPTTPTAYNAVSGTTIAYIVEENNLGLGAYINGTMIYGQALLNALGLSNVTYKGLVNETNFPSSLDATTTQAQLYVYLMKDHFLFQFKDKDIGYSYVDNDGEIKKYISNISNNVNVYFENSLLLKYIKEYKIPIKFISYGYSTRDLIGNSQQVLKYNTNLSLGNLQVMYYTSSTMTTTEHIFSYLSIKKATSSNFANNVLLCKFLNDTMLVNARNGVATTYGLYGGFTQVDVNYDSNTLQVNGANQLQVKTGTGIKSTANGIAVDLVAGDGISITDNTISVDLDNYDGGSF